jgi:predicted kinase
MKPKNLWITVGCPGSGKTTWIKNNHPDWVHISRDEVRYQFLAEDEEYFQHEDEVFEVFVSKILIALRDPDVTDVVADATHIGEGSRNKLLRALNLSGNVNINFLVFNIPLDTMLTRNAQRTGRERVPDEVIVRMYKSLTDPKYDKNIWRYKEIVYLKE